MFPIIPEIGFCKMVDRQVEQQQRQQVGLFVTGLKRVRIGMVNLGHLPVGQWRYLAPHERF